MVFLFLSFSVCLRCQLEEKRHFGLRDLRRRRIHTDLEVFLSKFSGKPTHKVDQYIIIYDFSLQTYLVSELEASFLVFRKSPGSVPSDFFRTFWALDRTFKDNGGTHRSVEYPFIVS